MNFKNVVMTRTFSKIYGLAGLELVGDTGQKKLYLHLTRLNRLLMSVDQPYLQLLQQ